MTPTQATLTEHGRPGSLQAAPCIDAQLVEAVAERTGRPVDLIDLTVVAKPLLGQIVRHGHRLLGSDSAYGQLISVGQRHAVERARREQAGGDPLRRRPN